MLALALLACQSEPKTPAAELPVISAYRHYAADNCGAVREEAQRGRAAGLVGPIEFYFDLLEGYCLEREGDVAGARRIYDGLVAEAPGSIQGYDAAQRLRDLTRLENEKTTRAEQKQLAEPRWRPGAAVNPAVKPVRRTTPSYPRAAAAAGVEGWVLIDYAVAKNGTTADAIVLDSNPPYVFESAALAALRGWSFEPPKGDENPRAAVVLRFEMEKDKPAEPPAAN